MKIRPIFEVETIDDMQYMVCLDSSVLSGMIQLNETAALIIECLKEDTTMIKIAEKIAEVYDVSSGDALVGVEQIIEQLKSINAIEE